MDSFLLYRDRCLAGEAAYPSFQDIYKDLNLNILLKTISQNDVFIMEQARSIMMVPVKDQEDLKYRYDIVKDFNENEGLIDSVYQLARRGHSLAEQYKKELEQSRGKTSARSSNIIASLRFISESISLLCGIRGVFRTDGYELHAEGLKRLSKRFESYPLEELEQLHNKFMFYSMGGEGLFSIRISGGCKLTESRLIDCKNYRAALTGTSRKLRKLYYRMAKKDTLILEGEELQKDSRHFIEENIWYVVETFRPWIEKALSFFFEFAREIAFYKGIYNFQKRMSELSLPLCYGEVSTQKSSRAADDLYELSLALYTQSYPVPNSIHQKDISLTVITGANQGGKSTFLRSFGIAQVMMQCGMPVPAKRFVSGLYSSIHTHFTRKEDAMLSRGRLEEELKRMDNIIRCLKRDSLLLLNESFASTTEKEGSQIAHNIIGPLYEKGIDIMMVTHLHEFAGNMFQRHLNHADFLVAERLEDGRRTFHILTGEPHYSSYGTDLYEAMIEKNEKK